MIVLAGKLRSLALGISLSSDLFSSTWYENRYPGVSYKTCNASVFGASHDQIVC